MLTAHCEGAGPPFEGRTPSLTMVLSLQEGRHRATSWGTSPDAATVGCVPKEKATSAVRRKL